LVHADADLNDEQRVASESVRELKTGGCIECHHATSRTMVAPSLLRVH